MVKHNQALPTYEAPLEVGVDNPLREKYPLHMFCTRRKYYVHSTFQNSTWIGQIIGVGLARLNDLDMGGIQRIWRMITGPNPASVIVWDIVIITMYLIINIIYLWHYTRPEPNHKTIKIISCVIALCILAFIVMAHYVFGKDEA